jgi:hypothetical protein
MSTVLELQAQHDRALSAADLIVSAAERQKRQLTNHEQQTFDAHLKTVVDLKPKIAAAKAATSKTVASVRA